MSAKPSARLLAVVLAFLAAQFGLSVVASAQPITPPATLPTTLPDVAEPPAELLKAIEIAPLPAMGPMGWPQARVLMPQAFNRGEPIKGYFLPAKGLSGNETMELQLQLCDSMGRVLAAQILPAAKPVVIPDQPAGVAVRGVPFEISVPNVLAIQHYLTVRGRDERSALPVDSPYGPAPANATFWIRPPTDWNDYVLAIWQRPNPQRMSLLRNVFINNSQASGNAVSVPLDLVEANFRFYVEGIGNWVFSAYHHSYPDKRPNQYEYLLIKSLYEKDRSNMQLLVRDPCLSDPIIRSRIGVSFQQVASRHRDFSPYFYSVADEPGIADQAAPFDFCFSRFCQDRYRQWLKDQYGSLPALNAEWGTAFNDWSQVRGQTTDELFASNSENFSQWCDFKDFMDSVQIEAYSLAKTWMRKGDPHGRIGMGGAQGPEAVGAWDFWKLSRVMDLIEAYYIGNNWEVIRGFAPNCILVNTSFPNKENLQLDQRLTWYLWMLEAKGQWVWDDKVDLIDAEGKPSEVGKAMVPLWKELTDGIGMLRIGSLRADEPVAIYESQANLRVHWVREVRPEGKDWLQRTSRSERVDSKFIRLRDSWCTLLADNGIQARFIGPQQLKTDLVPYDAKTGKGLKVLILPQALAMSKDEAEAIRKFVGGGGTVLADGMPANYDQHGKTSDQPLLADLFAGNPTGKAILLNKEVQPYYNLRLSPNNEELPLRDEVGTLLRQALGDAASTTQVVAEDGKLVTGVMKTIWRNGQAELIGIIHNPEMRINELGAQEYHSNSKFETPTNLLVRSATVRAWYDVRSNKPLGVGKEIKITLPGMEPLILTSLPAPAVPFTVAVDPGSKTIELNPGDACPLAKAVYHFDFVGPDGQERLMYRQNIVPAPKGRTLLLPLALNDQAGNWTLRVREVATGKQIETNFAWGK